MNIKDLIWGIVSLIVGVLFLIWNIKNPSGDENSETPYLDKQWDLRGYIGAFTFILVGIILIVKGSGILKN
ncbi:MAG: hypothetical protein LKE30_02520 [Bacteroidales bacterium]|jgi:uncharacterized integral membrane protein|nr:hypothetical protein [Bacteroidales bacterium]